MKGVTARVAGQEWLGEFLLVRLHCPSLAERLRPGHFTLVRLLPTWDPYLRVPLFPTILAPLSWLTYVPAERASARRLLEHAPPGTPLLVYGPFGRPFPTPDPHSHVLVMAQEPYVPYLMGLVHQVAATTDTVLLVEHTRAALPTALGWLPPAVEYQPVKRETEALEARVRDLAQWADYVYIAGPRHWPAYFARLLSDVWMGMRPERAFAIVPDDIACGLGLCDRCTLETRRRTVRACRKGPVFDLAEWFV